MMQSYDVVVIGAGPAGIFTALELTRTCKDKKILVVDSGSSIEKRACPKMKTGKCQNCSVCSIVSGWSGAGAFSDGKLSLSEEVGGNITDYISVENARKLIKYVDDIYLEFGAPKRVFGLDDTFAKEISYIAKKENIKLIHCPVRHMGTDHSYDVLSAMYEKLKACENFEFLEKTTATSIKIESGKVKGVYIKNNKIGEQFISATYVVAAPGRGGSAWLTELASKNNIDVSSNEIDIGVRVEVPNSVMDHLTKNLYESKFIYYTDTFENKVRTFCMNPGGIVSEEHYDGNIAVVNGHSYAEDKKHTDNTNFAILVSTNFTSPFTQSIEYGKYIAKLGNMLTGGGIMVQRLGDLLKGRRTDASRLKKSSTVPTLKNAVPGDLSFVLPHRHLTNIVEALKAFDKLAPGLYNKNTLLYGVEVKFYSSKIKVDSNLETNIKNFFAIGDGAGITRGLMQASVTGIVVAKKIAESLS